MPNVRRRCFVGQRPVQLLGRRIFRYHGCRAGRGRWLPSDRRTTAGPRDVERALSIIRILLEADRGFPEVFPLATSSHKLAGADAGNVVGGQFAHGNGSLAVWNAVT